MSRGSVKTALAAALSGGYLQLVKAGRAKSRGVSAQSAHYALRWTHEENPYTKDVQAFTGFFAGDGHRTQIPNSFFTTVLPSESLAVIKVVSAVIRHTNGYRNKVGSQRRVAPLSFSYLQNYANLSSRRLLSPAIEHAISQNYIERVSEGWINGPQSAAARYQIKWSSGDTYDSIGSKSEPQAQTRSVQKVNQADRFKKDTEVTLVNGSESAPASVQKVNQERFNKCTQERLSYKDSFQTQQQGSDAVVAREMLLKLGFDPQTAEQLAATHPLKEIEKQIAALPYRSANRNPLGLLRRSIEERWSIPEAESISPEANTEQQELALGFYAGHAQIQGRGVAQLSARDIEAATASASAFESIGDGLSLLEVGRKFGQFYRSRTEALPPTHISFSNALRTHGNAFTRTMTKRKSSWAGPTEAVDESQQQRDWLAYVGSIEARVRVNEPEAYQAFLDLHAAKRAQTVASKSSIFLKHPDVRTKQLTFLDSEEGRLDGFAKAFPKYVTSFQVWTQDHNLQRAGL